MREPPQKKPSRWSKIAASHGCDSIGVKEPPTILFVLLSDLSPHVSSARTQRMSQWALIRGRWKKGVITQTAKLPESTACWGASVAMGPAEEQKQRLVIQPKMKCPKCFILFYFFRFRSCSLAYIWEYHRIPSQCSFFFGHSTMASSSCQGS